VLLDEVLAALEPLAGAIVVDCTTGWAGHSVELLKRVGNDGRLIGLDLDSENLPQARTRLEAVGAPFTLHHSNFAGLPGIVAGEGIGQVDAILADLGMSSMQVDDAERGFSYMRDGPLDMRMDRSRGRSAAQLLATISEPELANALREFGDEPDAQRIARLLVDAAAKGGLLRTTDLARVLMEGQPSQDPKQWRLHPSKNRWTSHPAARTFQALRILVNRELANLEFLLRVLPDLLRPGGRAAIISFHSGEDRLVKSAFRDGLRQGIYSAIASEPIRASFSEKNANPRSRSAKLRWAKRAAT
jgi:16S rRNA (cytosine1402-N4)-methyltransferase